METHYLSAVQGGKTQMIFKICAILAKALENMNCRDCMGTRTYLVPYRDNGKTEYFHKSCPFCDKREMALKEFNKLKQ